MAALAIASRSLSRELAGEARHPAIPVQARSHAAMAVVGN
jgi:hypothetical protein